MWRIRSTKSKIKNKDCFDRFAIVAAGIAVGLATFLSIYGFIPLNAANDRWMISPILMERALRHTALGSHWLVLFAMYAYFKCRDGGYETYPVSFFVLSALAVLIHPYFLPLVMIFALITLIEGVIKTRKRIYYIVNFGGSLAVAAVMGYMIGALGTGIAGQRNGSGYGRLVRLSQCNRAEIKTACFGEDGR